jgi:Domain of unknown function (DUF2382)
VIPIIFPRVSKSPTEGITARSKSGDDIAWNPLSYISARMLRLPPYRPEALNTKLAIYQLTVWINRAGMCSESMLEDIDVGDPASPRGSNRVGVPPDSSSSDKQQPNSSSDSSSTAQEKLDLLAEELIVERRQVETGRVRVNVVTGEHQELVDMPLAREQVVVERVPIDKLLLSRLLRSWDNMAIEYFAGGAAELASSRRNLGFF